MGVLGRVDRVAVCRNDTICCANPCNPSIVTAFWMLSKVPAKKSPFTASKLAETESMFDPGGRQVVAATRAARKPFLRKGFQ